MHRETRGITISYIKRIAYLHLEFYLSDCLVIVLLIVSVYTYKIFVFKTFWKDGSKMRLLAKRITE